MLNKLIPIAGHLSRLDPDRDWTAQPNGHGANLISTTGHKIYCYTPSYPHSAAERFHLHPAGLVYANGQMFVAGHNHPMPSITVSKHRPSQSLANDIYRRLIPQAIEYIDWANGLIKKSDDHEARRNGIKNLLVEQGNGRLGWQNRDVYGPQWKAEVGYRADITLTLQNLDIETALQFLELFQQEQSHVSCQS